MVTFSASADLTRLARINTANAIGAPRNPPPRLNAPPLELLAAWIVEPVIFRVVRIPPRRTTVTARQAVGHRGRVREDNFHRTDRAPMIGPLPRQQPRLT